MKFSDPGYWVTLKDNSIVEPVATGFTFAVGDTVYWEVSLDDGNLRTSLQPFPFDPRAPLSNLALRLFKASNAFHECRSKKERLGAGLHRQPHGDFTMKAIILGAAVLALSITPAFAWDNPKPPTPAPAPATTINNSNFNAQQNKQLQFQGQFQGQTAIGKGGAGGGGGAGGNATQTVNVNPATGQPTPTASNTTVNNNGGATPSATFANVHTSTDGVNPWTNPVASAVAPSVYAASICQSAISGAAQTPLFGISFGSVQGLDVCIKLMLSEQAKTEGRPDVANYFKCQTKEFRDAYKATGTPCAQDMPKQMASATPVMAPTPTYATRADCIAGLNSSGQASAANVAACPR